MIFIGFERGMEPEKILGATDDFGGVLVLVKWKGEEIADLVEIDEAMEKCPQLLVDFFEEKLIVDSQQ